LNDGNEEESAIFHSCHFFLLIAKLYSDVLLPRGLCYKTFGRRWCRRKLERLSI
jgi:hypothetical protein